MKSLTEWLFSEAGAGWVFGLVSLIGLIVAIFNRKKPNRLVINEIGKYGLVNVAEQVGDRVQITYSGKQVDKLGQIEVEIFNEGSNVIKDADISCVLAEDTNILDVFLISSLGSFHTEHHISGNKVRLKIPYVNPYREHRHVIKLFINVNGEVETIGFEGGGEGWSIRHIPLRTPRQLQRKFNTVFGLMFGLIVVSIALNYAVKSYLGISDDETSPFIKWTAIPAIIGVALFMYFVIRLPMSKERLRVDEIHMDKDSNNSTPQ